MRLRFRSLLIGLLCLLMVYGGVRLSQAVTYTHPNYRAQHWDITLNAFIDAVESDVTTLYTNVAALGVTVANWVTTVDTPVLINATPSFVNDHTFTLSGNYTSVLTAGRRIIADLGQDPAVGNTVVSATYASPNTTVVVTFNNLTGNLQAISYYGTRSGAITYGSGDVVASEYGAPSWTNLQAAVSVANASGRRLVLTPGDWPVSGDLEITAPAYVVPTARFSVATTKTLTVNNFDAGTYQVFTWTGTGKVSCKSLDSAKAEWWGLGTGVNDAAALQAAIVACKDGGLKTPVTVGAGTFNLSGATVDLYKGVPVYGLSPQATIFTSTGNFPVFGNAEDLWDTGADGWTPVLANCTIDISLNANNIYAVYFDYSFNRCQITDVNILGNSAAAQGGIWCYHTSPAADNNLFDNNLFYNVNFRNLKATTGCLRLDGNSTPPGQQCNNNVIWHCSWGQYKQGIFINGSGNVIGGGSILNEVDNPVLQAGGGTDYRIVIYGSGSINNRIHDAYLDGTTGQVPVKCFGATISGLNSVIGASGAVSGLSNRLMVADLGTNSDYAATYVSAQTVTVTDDVTNIYHADYKVWWQNNSDGQWYSNTPVIDSTFGAGVTTITIPATGSQFSEDCTIYREPTYWRSELPAGTSTPNERGVTRFSKVYGDSIYFGAGATQAITGVIQGTESVDAGSVSAGGYLTFDIPATGAVQGQLVNVTPPQLLEDGLVMERWWTDTDLVKVRLYNKTGSPIDPAAHTWRFVIFKF